MQIVPSMSIMYFENKAELEAIDPSAEDLFKLNIYNSN